MTETYFPFDAGPGQFLNEDNWRELGGGWGTPGVIASVGNMLDVTAGSGMQVLVADGSAFAWGHIYNNDSTRSLVIDSNVSGTTRWDAIVVEYDWSANVATTKVVNAGASTAGFVPVVSRFTKLQFVRAWVRVDPGAVNITSNDVFPVMDCFAQSVGAMPTGTTVPYIGDEANVPPGFALPIGQVLFAPQYPRLSAILPVYDGVSVLYGLLASGDGLIFMPDLRGRMTIPADNMGGVAANRMAGGNVPGEYGGTAAIAAADLPRHLHTITPFGNHDHMPDVTQDADGNWPVLIENPFSLIGITLDESGATRAQFTRFAGVDPTQTETDLSAAPTTSNSKLPPYGTTNQIVKVC